MLKIQFAKRYPWDLHKAVILKLYADRIGTYFFFFFLYVCVCAYVRACVCVCVLGRNYQNAMLPSLRVKLKTRCYVNNFACISHLSKAEDLALLSFSLPLPLSLSLSLPP